MNSIEEETINNDHLVHDTLIKKEKLIDELKFQIDELEFISNNTKEYLFILEQEISKKNKKINSLQKDIKKRNKKIKSLKNDYNKVKKENNSLKSSTSWKITSPLRKLMNIFRR